ncbi:MAG: hypothetical protein JXB85_06260 [Anaerolineales bacterium]|nr:hypothetical protein [Anaerolineales bacterium]
MVVFEQSLYEAIGWGGLIQALAWLVIAITGWWFILRAKLLNSNALLILAVSLALLVFAYPVYILLGGVAIVIAFGGGVFLLLRAWWATRTYPQSEPDSRVTSIIMTAIVSAVFFISLWLILSGYQVVKSSAREPSRLYASAEFHHGNQGGFVSFSTADTWLRADLPSSAVALMDEGDCYEIAYYAGLFSSNGQMTVVEKGGLVEILIVRVQAATGCEQ